MDVSSGISAFIKNGSIGDIRIGICNSNSADEPCDLHTAYKELPTLVLLL
jgi:hypothetical protein